MGFARGALPPSPLATPPGYFDQKEAAGGA